MIWTAIGKLVVLAGLFLLVEASIANGQVFQWTRHQRHHPFHRQP